jgi:type IV pilus assembly protein PilC
MPHFFYHGLTRQGALQQGQLTANSPQEAVQVLRQRHLAVTHIRETHPLFSWGFTWSWSLGVRPRDVLAFTLQFGTMVKAGIPLISCLELLSTHSDHPRLREAVKDVRRRVETGSTLGEALRAHPSIFSETYVGLIEAGEAGGMLDHVLSRLAHHQQQLMQLRQQLIGALAYPLVIVLVATCLVMAMLIWVIPIFGTLFADFDTVLPWPTLLVLEISEWFHAHGLTLVVVLVVMGGLGQFFYHTKLGRLYGDRWVFQLPLVGGLLSKSMVVHVTRTLGSLLKSGVSMLEALDITARSSRNRQVQLGLGLMTTQVRDGSTLEESMKQSGLFPPMVTYMIGVGESTGALDTMLHQVADLYEGEVTGAVGSFTSMLEPFIIVLLGLGVGFLVFALYLPIFSMGSLAGLS